MADPDSRVHPNNEFRERLTEKVYSAVTETGRLAQQCIKGSRSHEILAQTTKQFVNQESAISNSKEYLRQCGRILIQMESQFADIHLSTQTISEIAEQFKPAYR